MKKLTISILFVFFLPSLIFGQAKQTAGKNLLEEITAIEKAWGEAAQKYDVSWFEKNLADGFVSTDENGLVIDKSTMVANVKNKLSNYNSVSMENVKVHAYGDTVIATGISILKGTFKGKDNTGRYQWTDTFAKIDGRWQCVATHSSKLPSK